MYQSLLRLAAVLYITVQAVSTQQSPTSNVIGSTTSAGTGTFTSHLSAARSSTTFDDQSLHQSTSFLLMSSDVSPTPSRSSDSLAVAASVASHHATGSATKAHEQSPKLPLKPTITPALAVAGVIMMLSGIAYTFIGIRKHWLYVFWSTAYTVALAIVVLITYVSNPPISNSVQGAYFIAAFVPAMLFGGVALIFKDVVEGLGCLLGGFCISMWLLAWKDGGLITSRGGKLGLIIALSLGAFSLSFSHHTRAHGLIACMSFAGATVIILGIDCFTRAGLKEFWLYLWDLNNGNIFPLQTTTYPRTHGISAENAGILVIACLGAISQMKLWNIVKERRNKRAEERLRDIEEREHLETSVGQRVEATNEKDRAPWEAVHGGKSARSEVSGPESTNGSTWTPSRSSTTKKRSISIREQEVSAPSTDLEMVELSKRQSSEEEQPPAQRTSEVKLEAATSGSCEEDKILRKSSVSYPRNSQRLFSPKSYVIGGADDEGRWEKITPELNQPEVVPIPFVVPTESSKTEHEDDKYSLATAGDLASEACYSIGKESSRSSTLRLRHVPDADSTMYTDIDDCRSSVAATLDGLTEPDVSLPALSRPASALKLDTATYKENSSPQLGKRHSSASLGDELGLKRKRTMRAESEANRRHSVAGLDVAPESTLGSLVNLPTSQKSPDAGTGSVIVHSPTQLQDEEVAVLSRSTSPALTKEHLPEAPSSTVMLYRTNEWAKHQAIADRPNIDELAPTSEPGVRVAMGREPTAPVKVGDLQQTSFSPQAAAPSRNSTQRSMQTQYRPMSNTHSPLPRSATISSLAAVQKLQQRSSSGPSGTSLQRSSSNPVMNPSAFNVRNPARFTSHPLLESPREDSLSPMSFNSAQEPPLRQSHNSLTNTRYGMLDNRASTRQSSDPGSRSRARPSSSMLTNLDNENMTLAQRRDSLRRRGNPRSANTNTPTMYRGSATLSLTRSSSTPNHPPPSTRRSARLSATPNYPPHASPLHQQQPHPSLYPNQHRNSNLYPRTPSNPSSNTKQHHQPIPPHSTTGHPAPSRDRHEAARQSLREQELTRRRSARDELIKRGTWEEAHRRALRRMEESVRAR
ncbi:MAG: hypothetical protein M1828_003994 [Chrysothrix sp. TS-e1954]|nr:MAG: hypothetical protein M1828_003994 [Chrysothrix sp. TS-e1954]